MLHRLTSATFRLNTRETLLSVFALVFSMIFLAGFHAHGGSNTLRGEATVKIEGMTCGGCETTIREKVTESPLLKDKVTSCTASATNGVAKIKFKDGVSMTQEELEFAVSQALKETSYTVATSKKAPRKSK